MKFVVKWLLKIPSHRKCVATLPCEIFLPKIVISTMYNWNETSFKMYTQFKWISVTYLLFVTSIQLTTRYGASSSSECISHGCTILTNASSVWCTSARLARHRLDHHWQCNWRVAWPSSCLCSGEGWTLWTNFVTILRGLRGLSFSRVTINVLICVNIVRFT